MKKIILTHEHFLNGEDELIKALIDDGLYAVHIRKSEATIEEMEDFMKKFDSFYRAYFVMHNHYSLVEKYAMKGMHYSDYKDIPEERGEWYTYSTSCHSTDEVDEVKDLVDYAFLSPIFDSISKPGYVSSWKDKKDITNFLMNHEGCEVIALGGVDQSKVMDVKHLCFDGYVMKGSVWLPFMRRSQNTGNSIQ